MKNQHNDVLGHALVQFLPNSRDTSRPRNNN